MDYLRDLSDFIDDLPDRDPFDPAVARLPSLEREMTALLRKLRARMDAFKMAQRCATSGTPPTASAPQEFARPPIHPSRSREMVARVDYHAPTRAREILSSRRNFDTNWVAARQRRQYFARASAPPPTCSGISPSPREIAVSQCMSLRAIEIPDASAITCEGTLYYIPRLCRFAVRICGITLLGNIGTVYVAEPLPQKIHDCESRADCNYAACRYYHNPLAHPGSTDIRNYVATSWLYNPRCLDDAGAASADAPRSVSREIKRAHRIAPDGTARAYTKKARKLASRANLDRDILAITPEDLEYYNEQLMHDILCGLLMNYYVPKDARAQLPQSLLPQSLLPQLTAFAHPQQLSQCGDGASIA